MTTLKYLQAYPVTLQEQVRQMIAKDQLGAYLEQRYPERHGVQSDKALYAYALALKQEHLRNAPAIDKVLFDNRLDLTHRALGLHTTISRVQGFIFNGDVRWFDIGSIESYEEAQKIYSRKS